MSGRRPRIVIGTTPCPNDSHLLGALATGQLDLPGIDLALELADIETLNQAVLAGTLAVAKISCAIYHRVAGDYALLDTGAALAEAHGPLVLASAAFDGIDLARARVAIPGENTTGAMLFRQWARGRGRTVCLPYDRIVPALVAGECDVGVVIHEGRFTYPESGLRCLEDLGRWWRATRALPVPLGCYVMRRGLYERHGARIEQLMRSALRRAEAGDPAIREHIRAHAQELDDGVIARHVALYVNHYTRSLGARGRRAIEALADDQPAGATA